MVEEQFPVLDCWREHATDTAILLTPWREGARAVWIPRHAIQEIVTPGGERLLRIDREIAERRGLVPPAQGVGEEGR